MYPIHSQTSNGTAFQASLWPLTWPLAWPLTFQCQPWTWIQTTHRECRQRQFVYLQSSSKVFQCPVYVPILVAPWIPCQPPPVSRSRHCQDPLASRALLKYPLSLQYSPPGGVPPCWSPGVVIITAVMLPHPHLLALCCPTPTLWASPPPASPPPQPASCTPTLSPLSQAHPPPRTAAHLTSPPSYSRSVQACHLLAAGQTITCTLHRLPAGCLPTVSGIPLLHSTPHGAEWLTRTSTVHPPSSTSLVTNNLAIASPTYQVIKTSTPMQLNLVSSTALILTANWTSPSCISYTCTMYHGLGPCYKKPWL